MVAALKTPSDVKQSILNLNDRALVKQGCDESSFTWGMSEEVHETTVGKKDLHINRSTMTFKGSTRYWNYLETCTCAGGLSSVDAIGTQLSDPINSGLTRYHE